MNLQLSTCPLRLGVEKAWHWDITGMLASISSLSAGEPGLHFVFEVARLLDWLCCGVLCCVFDCLRVTCRHSSTISRSQPHKPIGKPQVLLQWRWCDGCVIAHKRYLIHSGNMTEVNGSEVGGSISSYQRVRRRARGMRSRNLFALVCKVNSGSLSG